MNPKSLLFSLCTALLALCVPAPAIAQALTGKLSLSGSTTLEPVMGELAKRFSALHPGVEIRVEGGGSGRGTADALAGKVDIGMVSRGLYPAERSLFVFTVARDGVALVVHKDNPVKTLNRQQAIDILSGKLTRWKAVGGADAPIRVCTRPPGRGSLDVLSHYFGLSPEAIKAQCVAGDNSEAVRAILDDRNTVVPLSVGVTEDLSQKGQALRALMVDGTPGTIAALRSGSYPLSRPLNLVTREVPKGLARAFIEYALSAQAREVIRQFDFVPYEN